MSAASSHAHPGFDDRRITWLPFAGVDGEGCTVFMHMQGESDVMCEILDDELGLLRVVTVQDFRKIFDALRSA